MKISSRYNKLAGLVTVGYRKYAASGNMAIRPGMRLLALGITTLVSGCASYQPQPLPDQTKQLVSLDTLSVRANSYQGKIISHEINLTDGLDLTEVAILAVIGNPDLRAQRARLDIARAEVFAAKLLPDPFLSLGLDHPVKSGLVNATTVGFAYDIIPLITRGARIAAGAATQQKVRLSLLWQEWQVVQQARTLAVSYRVEQEKLIILNRMHDLYRKRYRRSSRGVQDGMVTRDVNGTDLSALMNSQSQIYRLEQTHNRTRHGLIQLLGLRSDSSINITALPVGSSYKKMVLQARLARLADIRPDLLALKAGYKAQESRVRAAILAQFPAFILGISTARDTGSIHTNGITIGLTIPLFSGNRGVIAIERASRTQLFHEYQARLARADTEVGQLLDLQDIVDKQQNKLTLYLPQLQTIVSRTRRSYQRGNINALIFLNMETTLTGKRLEKLTLEQKQWQIKIALQSLLLLPEDNIFNPSAPRENNHDN